MADHHQRDRVPRGDGVHRRHRPSPSAQGSHRAVTALLAVRLLDRLRWCSLLVPFSKWLVSRRGTPLEEIEAESKVRNW